jgi:hypothetical protein
MKHTQSILGTGGGYGVLRPGLQAQALISLGLSCASYQWKRREGEAVETNEGFRLGLCTGGEPLLV